MSDPPQIDVREPELPQIPDPIFEPFINSFPGKRARPRVIQAWIKTWFDATDLFRNDIELPRFISLILLSGRLLRDRPESAIRDYFQLLNFRYGDSYTPFMDQTAMNALVDCILLARNRPNEISDRRPRCCGMNRITRATLMDEVATGLGRTGMIDLYRRRMNTSRFQGPRGFRGMPGSNTENEQIDEGHESGDAQ